MISIQCNFYFICERCGAIVDGNDFFNHCPYCNNIEDKPELIINLDDEYICKERTLRIFN